MAARPRTLPAAIAPVLVGTAAAIEQAGELPRIGAFIAALVGSIFIQIGTNLANDYSDAKRGADTVDRLGPVRVAAAGLVAPRSVLVATWVAFGVAVAAGIYLATVAGPVILVVGAASILAGVLYTGGPRPYGYAGLGELFVFLFFGLVAVNGSYYVQLEELDWLPFGLSVSIGCLATAILVVNNVRDIDTDRRAGKRTLAVRLGRDATRRFYLALIVVAYLALPITLLATDGPGWAALGALSAPLAIPAARPVLTRVDGPSLNKRPGKDRRPTRRLQAALSAGLVLARPDRAPRGLEAIPYSLPFREPYVTSRGELTERRLILLRIRADGIQGLGETAALSLRGGPDLEEIVRQLTEHCRPALEEAPIDPQRLWSAIARCRNRGISAEALAAVDIALHDLAAKATGAPVWKLLGAERARPVPCNATLPAANPSRLRALAEEWAAEGFDTFKLKVGLPGDVTQVTTVRETLGPEVRIRVDANAAWTVEEASERLRAMARQTIELAEQPVGGLDAMALLRSRTRIPLAADESVASARDARRAVELDACQLATVKLAKVGGIAEALEIARVLPVYLSSALEGPVAIAAAAHAAQTISRGLPADLAHGLATERLFSATIGSGARLDRGRLEIGDGPGLGVELDEEALAAHRLD